MKIASKQRVILTLLLCFFFVAPLQASASTDLDKVKDILKNECTNLNKDKLYFRIRMGFSKVFDKGAEPEFFKIIEGVVKRTDFDGISEEITYKIIKLVYEARKKGAPLEYLDQIFDVAYSKDVSAEQLYAAANALKEFADSDVPQDIYEEFVYHSMEEQWEPSAVPVLAKGLIYGVEHGLTPRKVALAMIVDMDQGALKNKSADRLVSEAIDFVRRVEPGKWKDEGVNASNMKKEEHERIEKLKLEADVIKRRQKELEILKAEQQKKTRRSEDDSKAAAEIERLKKMDAELQRDYMAARQEMERLAKIGAEEEQRRKRSEREERRKKEIESMEMKIHAGRTGGIDIHKIFSAVERYLGIPYRYGGDSENGIDCSAFTRRVYREAGMDLPRTAAAQAQMGISVLDDNGLYSGDLVFFDTSIMGNINHVGVYLDNSTFAHASKSKGVVKSSLKERYYIKRYVKASRLFAQ